MQQRLVLHQAHCPSITQRVGSINLAQKSIVPNRQHATKRHRCIITNGIRGIQDFDASFEFESKEVEEALLEFLNDPRFHLQVINECKLTNVKGLEFTGMMFQPIPWSPNTPKGMPKEFEQYHESDDYTVMNIPPLLMFKAKVFKPSRLCAVFKHVY